jgi:hypothetical protein
MSGKNLKKLELSLRLCWAEACESLVCSLNNSNLLSTPEGVWVFFFSLSSNGLRGYYSGQDIYPSAAIHHNVPMLPRLRKLRLVEAYDPKPRSCAMHYNQLPCMTKTSCYTKATSPPHTINCSHLGCNMSISDHAIKVVEPTSWSCI